MELIRLGDVSRKIGSGATPRGGGSVYKTSGTALIRSQNVLNGQFTSDGLAFIDDDQAHELRGVTVEPGDILLNITGDSVARACLVPDDVLPARTNQHVSILRLDEDRLQSRYLIYFLLSPSMQAQMLGMASAGATRNALTKGMIEAFQIPAPPLPSQHAISSILGAFDDKIELNRRMNQTLEAIAQALFKSWFVDFDPVRAKMEGRAPEGLDAETAALFPSEFEESEIGMVPKGWRVGRLGEIVANYKLQVRPSEFSSDTPYFGLEHLPRKSIALGDWGVAENLASNKFRFRAGQLLFGKLRPYFHKVGVAPMDGVCSTDILVLEPMNVSLFALVLGHMSSEEFVGFTDTGEGSKMPRTDWGRMRSYAITIPPASVSGAATAIIRPMIARIISNIHESRALAAVRDALLPKLIYGEIRVPVDEDLTE